MLSAKCYESLELDSRQLTLCDILDPRHLNSTLASRTLHGYADEGAIMWLWGWPLTCELVVIVSTLATSIVFPFRRTMPDASAPKSLLRMRAHPFKAHSEHLSCETAK